MIIEQAHVEAAMGQVAGLRVLDVGCGTGRHALRLASAGAVVTGVDFSEGMLEHARRKAGELGLSPTFAQHDIAEPFPFGAASSEAPRPTHKPPRENRPSCPTARTRSATVASP